MQIFSQLFFKLIPFYLIIALGFYAGKKLGVRRDSIAPLLIYIVTPIIVFHGIMKTELTVKLLSLPLLFFCLCSVISISFLPIANIFSKKDHSLIAISAGSGNVGYFGIPIALMIFGDEHLGLIVLSMLGTAIYVNSLGFFIAASGHYSIREGLIKSIKLPTIYAAFAAVLIKLSNIEIPNNEFIDGLAHTGDMFTGAYSILGMLMIGLGLADIKEFKLDLSFISLSFIGKFIIFPLFSLLFIYIDLNFWHIYSPLIHQIMMIMSLVPIAATTISTATELKMDTELLSITVLLSTVFALFYLPLVCTMIK